MARRSTCDRAPVPSANAACRCTAHRRASPLLGNQPLLLRSRLPARFLLRHCASLPVIRHSAPLHPAQQDALPVSLTICGNRSQPESIKKAEAAVASALSLFFSPLPKSENLSWRRPTFPHSYPCSIIGPAGLNFRVRDGNGCDPRGMATRKFFRSRGCRPLGAHRYTSLMSPGERFRNARSGCARRRPPNAFPKQPSLRN